MVYKVSFWLVAADLGYNSAALFCGAAYPLSQTLVQTGHRYGGGEVSGMRGQAARRSWYECSFVWFALAWLSAGLMLPAPDSPAQQRPAREPNGAYAARRAKLAAEVDAPIVLWGYTGREESSQAYIFAQEENFYYLTGHNEEGAAIIVMPASEPATGDTIGAGVTDAVKATLFLPARDPAKEKWNGVRLSPSDPGIEARTGFSTIKPFSELRVAVTK